MRNSLKLTLSTAALAALTACGGGSTSQGGGDTPTQTPPPAEQTYFTDNKPANISALPGSYADVNRSLAFERLNAVRQEVGLGALRQVAQIDNAAQGHADWLSLNDYYGHYQVVGTPGFTGQTPEARNLAAGYNNFLTEVQSTEYSPQPGDEHVNDLLTGPYHRMAMFYYRADEAGVGHNAEYPSNIVINLGRNPGQGAPSTLAVIWPADGSTNVRQDAAPEVPNPMPENNGAPYGYPVSLCTHELKTLVVTAFTLEDQFGGTVSTKLLDYATDDNLRAYRARHFASIIPRAPLESGKTYVAKFTGTIDGTPYTKQWSFTTR